jgi:conjugative transfer signal peptidase TraF
MADRADLPLFRWSDTAIAALNGRRRRRRRAIVIAIAGASALLLVPAGLEPAPRLVWNASPSVPIGLYLVSPGAPVTRGATVIAWLPAAVRDLAASRRYLPASVPLVKPVAGIAGDRVCAAGIVVAINGRTVARRLRHDHRGRPLPFWSGCRTLRAGELFVLGTQRPDSFDSRYFGRVARRNIIGTARLIWPR